MCAQTHVSVLCQLRWPKRDDTPLAPCTPGAVLTVAQSVQLFKTQWTVPCHSSVLRIFSQGNTGVGCHFLPGIFLTERIRHTSPVSAALQADSSSTGAIRRAHTTLHSDNWFLLPLLPHSSENKPGLMGTVACGGDGTGDTADKSGASCRDRKSGRKAPHVDGRVIKRTGTSEELPVPKLEQLEY